jgi:hypothetical protein
LTQFEPPTSSYSNTDGQNLANCKQKVREFVEAEEPCEVKIEPPAKWLEASKVLIEAADGYFLEFQELGMRMANEVAELKDAILVAQTVCDG